MVGVFIRMSVVSCSYLPKLLHHSGGFVIRHEQQRLVIDWLRYVCRKECNYEYINAGIFVKLYS